MNRKQRRGFTAAEQLEARILLSSNVLTNHGDIARTGANLAEAALTPANVNSDSFGKLATVPLDGNVFAQPLYLSGVSTPSGLQNLAFVATEHDNVYAINTDTGALFWQKNFGVFLTSADIPNEIGDTNIGITGTPVIDSTTGILYFVAASKATVSGATVYTQKLHAVDILTGNEALNGPVTIQGAVAGTGAGNDGKGHVPFQNLIENQRPGLLLANNTIYIAWASHGDAFDFHGWVMGYNATTLQQTAIWNATPNGTAGGIWMSGGGLSADAAGNIYVAIGNGTFDGTCDWGDSVVKLSPSLVVLDSFTPSDQAARAASDGDLGSSDVLLLPDQPGPFPHLLVVGAKDGTSFLLNRDGMGGFSTTHNNVVQQISSLNGVFASFSYFKNALIIVDKVDPGIASNPGTLNVFPLSNGLALQPIQAATEFGYPGANAVVSANGATNGIIWAIQSGKTGILHAYSADNPTHELYNSSQFGAADQAGKTTTFATPTVVDGKVLVAGAAQLDIYGLLPTPRVHPHQTFVMGSDQQVYIQRQDAAGNPIGNLTLTSPGVVKAISWTQDAANRAILFVVGLDHQVFAQRFSLADDSLGSYALTTGGFVKSLVAGIDGLNEPLLYVIGTDDQVYQEHFDANGNSTSGFNLVAVGTVSTISLSSLECGQTRLNSTSLASGTSQHLLIRADGTPEPQRLTSSAQVKSIIADHNAAGDPELFAIGLDNQLYVQHFDSLGISGSDYVLSTGGVIKAAAVTHDASHRPLAFVIGLDDRVYEQTFDASGNSTSGYVLTAPGTVFSMVAGHDAANDPLVIVLGGDHQAYQQTFDGSGKPTAGYALAAAGIVSTVKVENDANNRPVLFVTGSDGGLYAAQIDGGKYVLTGAGIQSQYAIGHDSSGNLQTFIVSAGQVYTLTLNSKDAPVGQYLAVPGGLVGSLLAVGNDPAGPVVFIQGYITNFLYLERVAGGLSYTGLGYSHVTQGSAGSDAAGGLIFFAMGDDGTISRVKLQPFWEPGLK